MYQIVINVSISLSFFLCSVSSWFSVQEAWIVTRKKVLETHSTTIMILHDSIGTYCRCDKAGVALVLCFIFHSKDLYSSLRTFDILEMHTDTDKRKLHDNAHYTHTFFQWRAGEVDGVQFTFSSITLSIPFEVPLLLFVQHSKASWCSQWSSFALPLSLIDIGRSQIYKGWSKGPSIEWINK